MDGTNEFTRPLCTLRSIHPMFLGIKSTCSFHSTYLANSSADINYYFDAVLFSGEFRGNVHRFAT